MAWVGVEKLVAGTKNKAGSYNGWSERALAKTSSRDRGEAVPPAWAWFFWEDPRGEIGEFPRAD